MKNKFKTVLTAVMAIFALVLSSFAIGNVQTQYDTNRLTFASTNFYNVASDVNSNINSSFNASSNQVPGGVQYLDCGKASTAFLQFGGLFTNSTANSSNITFQILWSGDFANWTTNVTGQSLPSSRYLLVIPASSTNWCSALYTISNCPPACTLRSCENSNTSIIGAATNSVYLKVIQKLGI